jgi:hypothetical protein
MKAKQVFNPIIQTSYDYAKFKFLKCNRNVNQVHILKLKESMRERALVSLITINERNEIIDGQHRFLVCKELGLPINYVLVYGYGIKEVQTLNLNSHNWKKLDFLDGFIKQGKREYSKFAEFQNEFPLFNFSTCLKLLRGGRSNGTTHYGNGVKSASQDFENGTFTIPDIEQSRVRAKAILDFKDYFPKFNDNTFVISIMLLMEHKNYNHKEMMAKLKLQPTALIPCKTQAQYILSLEDIYNYFRKSKVSFRY